MREVLGAAGLIVIFCIAFPPGLWVFFHFQTIVRWWMEFWFPGG